MSDAPHVHEPSFSCLMDMLRTVSAPAGPETVLSRAVSSHLQANNVPFKAEFPLSGGAVDFMVGTTAIELKVKGQCDKIFAQIMRYIADPACQDIILVTSSKKIDYVISGAFSDQRFLVDIKKRFGLIYIPTI